MSKLLTQSVIIRRHSYLLCSPTATATDPVQTLPLNVPDLTYPARYGLPHSLSSKLFKSIIFSSTIRSANLSPQSRPHILKKPHGGDSPSARYFSYPQHPFPPFPAPSVPSYLNPPYPPPQAQPPLHIMNIYYRPKSLRQLLPHAVHGFLP